MTVDGAVLVRLRSALEVAVVAVVEAVLLPGIGSAVVALTVAVLVRLNPAAVPLASRAVTPMVVDEDGATVPTGQVTV